MRLAVLATAALLVGFLPGCYDPTLRACSILCAADGSCPYGTTCGADRFCHAEPGATCTSPPGPPDGPRPPDARTDAPRPPDAPPDARADAPPDARPDAPPDAAVCAGATTGEPDDACPGEALALREGQSLAVTGRALSPAGDLDRYGARVQLQKPQSCAAGQVVTYALRVELGVTTAAPATLSRFPEPLTCGGTPQPSASRVLCIPFTQPCAFLPSTPTVSFQVGGGAGACVPYTLSVTACAAGSTCDACTTL